MGMNYTTDALREASEASGVPFDYLARLLAAETSPEDPRGEGALVRQMIVIFDHYLAKSMAGPNPVEDLKGFGFTETADILQARRIN